MERMRETSTGICIRKRIHLDLHPQSNFILKRRLIMNTCNSLVQKSVPEKDMAKEAERIIETAERNQIIFDCSVAWQFVFTAPAPPTGS